MKISLICKSAILAILGAVLFSCATAPPEPGAAAVNPDQRNAQQLTGRAQATFESFMADSKMGALRENLKSAKGVFIMPQLLKGAFIVGASGGSGVFLARSGQDTWQGPSFYTVGGASFGLQAGGEAAEVILVIMSDRGVRAFQSSNFKLGVDAGIAAGPVGIGAAAQTANLSADILSYSRAKGLYGGISLDGAIVGSRTGWNDAYYGKVVTPAEILMGKVKNPQSARLRTDLAQAGRPAQAASRTGGETGKSRQ